MSEYRRSHINRTSYPSVVRYFSDSRRGGCPHPPARNDLIRTFACKEPTRSRSECALPLADSYLFNLCCVYNHTKAPSQTPKFPRISSKSSPPWLILSFVAFGNKRKVRKRSRAEIGISLPQRGKMSVEPTEEVLSFAEQTDDTSTKG